MPTTTEYDINLYCEGSYSEFKLLAYRLRKNEFGDWESDTDDTDGVYTFTPEDNVWLITNSKNEDGTPFVTYPDDRLDEWFTSNELLLGNVLPPRAVEWLTILPEYEYEDLTEESK